MSIQAKLFFYNEERNLLHTNLNYHRFTRWNGKPSSGIIGGYLTVTFTSEMYDDSFLEAMVADRYDNKKIEYPFNLYKLHDGKIVFYKDEIDGEELFVYSFKDAVITEYKETFNNQTGMYVTLTISPAIQDYRLFNESQWNEKSPTRLIKPWEENYISPKETSYKAKEDTTPRFSRYFFEDNEGNKIAQKSIQIEDKVTLVIETSNAEGETITINLNDDNLDFKYQGKILKNDTLSGVSITGRQTRVRLTAVEQQN